MKKFLSLSLALILCVALSVPAFAANYTSYTWSDEYTTMKFDAAAVATETIKAWDYDPESLRSTATPSPSGTSAKIRSLA